MSAKVTPIDELFKKQQLDTVITYDNSDIFTPVGAFGRRYNPDQLVSAKGLHIYGQMMHDEQVKAVCEFKSHAILGRGWEFRYDEDCELSDDEKELRTEFFKCCIRKMQGSFLDVLDGVASGREFGYSVSEKVYSNIKFRGRSYVGINKIVVRNPDSFEFFTDEYGEFKEVRQRSRGTGAEIFVDRAKIIHYVHKPKWDIVYGRSDLRAAYRSWYCKDVLIKLWTLYLEKFGGGIFVAKRTSEANISYPSAAHTALENTLKNIRSMNSIILPPGVEGQIFFPPANDGYEKAITFFDLAIAKSLLVPNLLGLSHTGQTGAFAQSQTQLEAFYWSLMMDGQRLADTVNEQLFRDLGDQNFGDGDYPVFEFKPASQEHIKWIVETWQKLVSSNVVINTEKDEEFIRKLMDMPIREEDSVELVSEKEQKQMSLEEEVARAGIQQGQEGNEEVKKEIKAMIGEILKLAKLVDDKEPSSVVVNNQISPTGVVDGSPKQTNKDEHAPVGEVHFHGPLIGCTTAMAKKAAARTAFAVIGKRTDDIAIQSINEVATLVAKSVQRALGDEENLTNLLDDDATDVGLLDLSSADVGKLKATFLGILKRAWNVGTEHARTEIQRARVEAGKKDSIAINAAALKEKAASYLESQGFRMAGDLSANVRKIMQQEIQNGIKFDKTTTEVRAEIWNRLVAKGMTKREIARGVETDEGVQKALDLLWLDSPEQATAYLDTLVRTTTFEALNEARFNEFSDPALSDLIQALQYAAVLDESTTEICYSLGTEGPDGDGVIYTVDSSMWDTYRPPNHYNCRAVLVAITIADGWDGEESEEPVVEPQEGFK